MEPEICTPRGDQAARVEYKIMTLPSPLQRLCFLCGYSWPAPEAAGLR
jgi:hypothetical protein